jgi:hypothetical protein
MKNALTILALLLTITVAKAQTSNVILFTENGEKFFAILNGVRQNNSPETNVKLTELNANFYKLKIIFDDAKLGEKSFNLGFNEGMETTFVIKLNTKKNEYVLRPVSETPVAQAPPPAPNQTVVVYQSVPSQNAQPVVNETVTHTTTTTSSGLPADNVNVSIGMNVGETGGGFNMNVSGMNGTTQTTSTHSTTTTTVVTSNTNPVAPPPPPAYLPGYNGPIGCPVPMSPQDFSDLKSTIGSKSFEDSKMTIAKQVLKNYCMLTSQVKDLMGLFTFEETKLDFAKYAYDYTYDIGNYFKVNDMFTFESSIDDLNRYINGKRR